MRKFNVRASVRHLREGDPPVTSAEAAIKIAEIYRDALDDIVMASRDDGLASMVHYMRNRAVVALQTAYAIANEVPEEER